MSEAALREQGAVSLPVREGFAAAKDGARLHWRIFGDGPGAPLVCSNGIGVSTFFWHHLEAAFGAARPVVTWDYRGHGSSPVPQNPDDTTVSLCASDLWSVADAAGVDRAVLVGHSMGCQVALEAIRQQPSRAAAFVPMLGASGRTLTSFPGGDQLRPVLRRAIQLLSTQPAVAQVVLRTALRAPGLWPLLKLFRVVHPERTPRDELEPYFAHLKAIDLRCYFALLNDLLDHDASDLLPELKIPALVVAGSNDKFTPLARSEEMAGALRYATLLVIPDGSHAAMVEQPELIQLALEKFLRRHQIDRGG